MEPLVWSILLLVVGLLLISMEIFVPSGGILGFVAISAVLASVVLAFYSYSDQPWIGITFLVVAVIGLPSVLAVALKFFPDTPMGRRILLRVPSEQDVLPEDQRRQALRELVGKVGVADTLMLPSGAVRIEGRSVNAMSQGMAIEAGQRVRVVEVQGNTIVVRPLDPDESPRAATAEDDVLAQPLDKLGLDPLDDPLA